ncbi:alpha/beta hydrolase family esterase [Spirillospora sp. NPDC048911]|uniref:alpha/beta hydrolase family esterase n=1 Tax=Spirillospora sp. NPDC048911 TaxID=3364527 RepID=UPI0037170E1A
MKIIMRAALMMVALCLATSAHPLPATAAAPAALKAPGASGASGASRSPVRPAPPAASSTPVKPGTHARTITMPSFNWLVKEKWERTYLLHVPQHRRAAKPPPLVIALHGGLDDSKYIQNQSGLDAVSERHGFVVAYPDGFLRTWNAGGCCWFARLAQVDDVAFIDQLITTLVKEKLADPRRIYLTGFSNGGGLAYKYVCERPNRVAAIGVVSGALATACPSRPKVSLLAFHGTSDFSVPYNGGGNLDFDVKEPFLPVQTVVDIWRRLAGLPALAFDYFAKAATRCKTTGRSRTEVALCTVTGGGHEWPVPTKTAGVDGTEMLWSFFAAHPRSSAAAKQ